MQENSYNSAYNNQYYYPQIAGQSPNAVSINIISPQAYASPPQNGVNNIPYYPQNAYYSLYNPTMQPNMPLYPANYNNLMTQPQSGQVPLTDNSRNALQDTNLVEKTPNSETNKSSEVIEKNKEIEKIDDDKKDKKDKKPKTITPLTDDYIKSLENYLNNDNPKVRLIGAKDVLERFKEDDNRKDNPSLVALLNKTLRDSSPSVRFLGLTALQLGYSVGNDETVSILKEIQSTNKDKLSQDSLLASEILLKLSAGQPYEVEEGESK